jgi:hypothetical protein
VIGSDLNGTNVAWGQIEEFTTFTGNNRFRQLTGSEFGLSPYFDVANYYAYLSPVAALGPVTEDELASGQSALSSGSFTPSTPNGGDGGGFDPLFSYPSNSLWLEVTDTTQITNSWLGITIHGTSSGVDYDLLYSSPDLIATNANDWPVDQTVQGAADSDSTFTWVSMVGRTNLFLRARSWQDSDGQGLPDWWQMKYFGHLGVDPWLDSDFDGWSNMDEYILGKNPTAFDTPPPPRSVMARLDSTGTNVVLTWRTGGGEVIGYLVVRQGYMFHSDSVTYSVSETTFSFTDSPTYNFITTPSEAPKYMVIARFPNGVTSASGWVSIEKERLDLDTRIVRGPGGRPYLTVPTAPANVSRFHFNWFTYDTNGTPIFPGFDVYATNMVKGILPIPLNQGVWTPQFTLYVRPIFTNSEFGENNVLSLSSVPYIAQEDWYWPYPFATATNAIVSSAQLKENLRFLLRSATEFQAFSYGSGFSPDSWENPELYPWTFPVMEPDTYYSRPASSANYEYCGFHFYSPRVNLSLIDVLRPMREHFFWRNFAFSTADFDSTGTFDTGIGCDFASDADFFIRAINDPRYVYNSFGTESPLPLVLTNAGYTWSYLANSDSIAALSEGGMYVDSNTNLHLNANTYNQYGLSINSIHFQNDAGNYVTLTPGNSIHAPDSTDFFMATDLPDLQPADYYFVSETPYFRFGYSISGNPINKTPPLPGAPTFSYTSTTPVLIASLGEPITVSGWAKFAIANSHFTNRFAYLEQYWDKAYRMTNGVATTNETGLLSPYGEFFPTEAGPIALKTLGDVDTGAVGTGVVHVISLSTDANHDGTIDTTFYGPDFTSPSRPFRFWVNDDDDKTESPGLFTSTDTDIPGQKKSPNGLDKRVNGTRDLVDFFPVYVNIQSALQALPNNVTCWLKQEDSALNVVDPDFYNLDYTIPPTNCLAYMTNSSIGPVIARPGNATYPAADVFRITSSGYQLSYSAVDAIRTAGKAMLLVEARTNTTRPLVLEIHQGTNVLAQASLYLSITPVEQMFRHKNLMPEQTITNLHGPPDRLTDADVPNEPDTNDKNFVLIHGYSVNPNQARGNASETFKRMYWSGSHAKFYGVTWFSSDSQGDIYIPGITPNYHTNVVHAFQTASNLAAFFGTLTNGPTVALAHSLGNLFTLSALNDWNARIDKYFMMDAAVAIEALQGDAPQTNHMIFSDWVDYTNRLYSHEWHSLFPSNDARSSLSWTNRFADLHNTDVYNFYSSGEEVLRDYPADPPTGVLSSALPQLQAIFADRTGSYVWVWQEKAKGRCSLNWTIGSTHGGWKFNTNYGYSGPFGVWLPLEPTNAVLLSDSQLQTNAFFDFGSVLFNADVALQGAGGSNYAQTNRNRILADAIPAMTLPVGANPVPKLSPLNQPSRNFNMQALYKNGWPASRTSTEELNWHHSDFKDVAYTYIHPLFDQYVSLGNLQ